MVRPGLVGWLRSAIRALPPASGLLVAGRSRRWRRVRSTRRSRAGFWSGRSVMGALRLVVDVAEQAGRASRISQAFGVQIALSSLPPYSRPGQAPFGGRWRRASSACSGRPGTAATSSSGWRCSGSHRGGCRRPGRPGRMLFVDLPSAAGDVAAPVITVAISGAAGNARGCSKAHVQLVVLLVVVGALRRR